MAVYSNNENEIFHCNVTYKTYDTDDKAQGDFESNNLGGKNCKKKEFHNEFIPFNKIRLEHFDEPYNRQEFIDLTKTLGNLVVKLELTKTSSKRPTSFPKRIKYGTGRITFSKPKNGTRSRHCPCKDCSISTLPETKWGEISVVTAAHVLFDQLEVENSICILRYNKEDSDKMVTLEGVKFLKGDENDDRSHVIFVTHDMKLVETLKKSIYLFRSKHQAVYKKYKALTDNNLAILVSHPHGWPKQVSIGRYEKNVIDYRTSENIIYTHYLYDLHSCPGSSGAPVFFLGKKEVWSMHPHSKGAVEGDRAQGKSSVEYERV